MRFSFATWNIPENEKKLAQHIELKVSDLQSYVENFEYAVALFDHVEPLLLKYQATSTRDKTPWMLSAWLFTAARDAALMLYHVRSCLHSIKSNVESCSSVLKRTSIADLEAAIVKLESAFPALIEVRHAVAHAADQTFSLKNRSQHATKTETVTEMFIGGDLENRNLVYTRNGERVSIHISRDESVIVHSAAELALNAFK